MRPTLSLLTRRLPIHVTLFTRKPCSLCDIARTELSHAWDKRPFEFAEVNVMKDEKWRIYEFDVPVIHIAKTVGDEGGIEEVGKLKLMHRFKAEEVIKLAEEVMGADSGGRKGE